jgi:hypothetical protein
MMKRPLMSIWVVAGVVLTGAWTQLDEIGRLMPLALLLIVFALDRYQDDPVPLARRWPGGRVTSAPIIAAALLSALHLAHVLLTAREEFGFGGDEGYHLSATRAFVLYYLRAAPFLAVALAVFAAARWKRWRYAASAALAVLLVSSVFLPANVMFGRYPAGFYHLAAPLNVAFDLARVPYPFTANHIMNALSVPAWLFLLRPLVIGRWPDWQVLPAALLLYFQAPAFTYVASTLIEPWSIVFLLLALEVLVAFPENDRWAAVLLASVATCFKETAIFLLPTIWLLACIKWEGYRPSLGRGALAVGIAAVTPFAVYYLVRLDAEIHRTVSVATAAEVWRPARLVEWFTNVRAALGITAVVAVTLLFVGTMRHLLWALTALGLTVFFFVDVLGIPWTGYSRYLAFSLVALAGAVFATTYRMTDRRVLIAIAATMAALQAVPVTRALALDFRPDYERNSLEWNRSLVRLPIRTLLEKLPAFAGGTPARVRVITFGTELTSLQVAYPDLANRYELQRGDLNASPTECACRDHAEAVLAAFEWPAHFGDTAEARSAFEQLGASCVQQVEATCRAHQVERDRRGAAVGVIGAGAR